MTKIEVSAARKNELMDSCQNGNLQEKLSAIRELMHYPDDDVKMSPPTYSAVKKPV